NVDLRFEETESYGLLIIYSLPFLSIIDQNSSVFREVLAEKSGLKWRDLFDIGDERKEKLLKEKIPSNLLLIHHHLADVKYKEKKQDNELYEYKELLNSLLLTEGWYSEVVISTFVQLFHSLITNRNRAARKFHNITNSIIVLDEVQSIPVKYWGLVNTLSTFLSKNLNCWIILMTATRPLIFKNKEIYELASKKKKYFEFFDRIKYRFDLETKRIDDLKSFIFDKKKKDVMIVLNTINSCKELYLDLKKNMSSFYGVEPIIDDDGICHFGEIELINLSTHILPSNRMKRISRIKKDNKQKVIVTTQLVEAGVDISVDIIYRDFAPLDSIVQAAGRCNREFGSEKGIVRIIRLEDENTGKTYCSYIYDPTIMDITKELVDSFKKKESERDFNLKGSNKYYELISERKTQDIRTLEYLNKLKFNEIGEFNLIEENVDSLNLFVEIDEEAASVRESLRNELLDSEGFERKEKFLKWRKMINDYVLSVKGSNKFLEKLDSLPFFLGDEKFRVIPKKDVKNWYNQETGFKIPDSTFDVRLI
ncbi:MAG: CRISPR-associated helicase/endonuclease Cas3, partial [Elusimicrobiota bacterium]